MEPDTLELPQTISPTDMQTASLEAEENVLGCIIMRGDLIHDLKKWLKPHHFWRLPNQWIYEAMLALANRHEDIDYISLSEELKARNQFDQIDQIHGGSAYLNLISNQVPSSYHATTYGRIVKEYWRRRSLLLIAQRIAQTTITFSPDGGESDYAKRLIEEAQELFNDPYDPDSADGLRQYLVHARDLHTLPDAGWLVQGEIPESSLTIVFGPSGAGKSFLVLHYGLMLSERVKVLYVASEGESGYKKRVAAWEKYHQKEAGDMHFYFNVAQLLDENERKAFISQIVEHVKPRLIILDTLAHSMLPGDENSTRDMGLFIKAAKQIQKQYDCTVLLVHHTNKGGKDERGSVALRGATDSIIKVFKEDDLLVVEHSKLKDGPEFEPKYMKLLPVLLGTDESNPDHYAPVIVPAEKIIRSKTDPVTNQQRKILLSLADDFAFGAMPSDLVETTSIQKGSLLRSLGELRRLGFVTQEEKGAPYNITPDGLAAIDRKADSDSSRTPKATSPNVPAQRELNLTQDSRTPSLYEISQMSPVSPASPMSLESPGVHSNYEKVSQGVCPVCDKPLVQNGTGLKCPDCGLKPRVK